jgi:hypothetical protein
MFTVFSRPTVVLYSFKNAVQNSPTSDCVQVKAMFFFHNLSFKILVCLMLWKIVINMFIKPPKIKVTKNFVVYFLSVIEVRNVQELWELHSDTQ